MDHFEHFLSGLLREGTVVFREAPPLEAAGPEPEGVLRLLSSAFAIDRLDIAGPEIAFDPRVACRAGRLVWVACWALVSREDRVEDLGRALRMGRGPRSASEHASADLLLRHLPHVYGRARAISPSDPLVDMLGRVLGQWPLSGVLAGLDDGPTTPLDLGGHRGLMLRYAERFARRPSPAWRPEGEAGEWIELVIQEGERASLPAS